ncbi:NAD(P)-dependent oxidoreductase [Lyngbya sp. PCC 8106]|uniref:SDR family oxidoreductase n=1 Tax=Lyngbya sp. (strain PCC 8106) TaxID=313612 RepID=UPI0000EA9BBE|nr:NAD(P)-dependent oxidoreductase [Lyngbya sp. PCC 8106]EAW37318.1 3-beta hydroxysteroid dehydrogenase/isomerase [Lyngbya sp. PCC 8106]
MKKILVTGASGFLGWNICQIAASQWEVYGTYRSKAVKIPGVNIIQRDLTDFQGLKALIEEIQPTAIIHAAAQSKPNYCQLHPDETYPINVTASINLAGLCADYSIACAFTSTDLVFNGLNPPYKETDPVSPVSIYGEQKVAAEQGMLERNPQVAVCRMPLMFGKASPHAVSFIQGFVQALKAGKELQVFTDEYRTSVSGTTAAEGLLLALAKAKGILHLGGKERMSRYDFAQLMAEVFELPIEKIQPCLQQDVQMPASRPPDVSLDSSKAFGLGYQPLSIREELERLRGQV